ncbi:MAG: hypothetical protein K9H64_22720 [Bacteroidales bacterium]|nr:hypothetical protein [Bacteroidales bacterium]MCF8458853.1 hypothetical protein [Bacteroidales bacterium]
MENKNNIPAVKGFNEELDFLRKEAQKLLAQWEFMLEDLTAVNLFFNGVVNEFGQLIDGIFSLWDEMEGALDMPGMTNLKNLLKSQTQKFKDSIPASIDFEQFKQEEEKRKAEIKGRESSFYSNFFGHANNPDKQLEIHQKYNAAILAEIAKLQNEGSDNRAFLTRISNELMMPINSFMGFSDSMSMLNPVNDEFGLFAKINSSARNFAGLMNDYALFKQIRDKSVPMRNADFNFQDELIKIIEKYTARAQDAGLELFYKIDPTIPTNIISDKAKINQFISLLIENSMQLVSLTNRINQTSGGKLHLELMPITDREHEKIFRISVIDKCMKFKSSALKEVHQYYSYYHDLSPYTGLKLKITGGMAEIIGAHLQFETLEKGNSFYVDLAYESL